MAPSDRPRLIQIAALTALMVLTMPLIAAHVPQFGQGGGGLNDAREVDDPTKSWVIYTSHDGSDRVSYYKLSLKKGDRILLGLIVPAPEGQRGFSPDMVLMGPGLEDNGTVPPQVQETGEGHVVITSDMPSQLVYEPFSPSVFYELARIEMDAPADGDYYVAVYNGPNGGDYGLVVGKRESFSLSEWLTIPFSLLAVYRWEGQQWWTILLPGVVAFLAALSVASMGLRSSRPRPDVRWSLLSIAGSLMIASAAVFGYQTVSKLLQVGDVIPAAALSAAFTIIPLLLGIASLRMARRSAGGPVTAKFRLALLVIAALGLVFWSGWIVGPVLVATAALLPSRLAQTL